MEKESLIKVLLPWNFWEKEPAIGLPREDYIREALGYLKTNKILTLVGIRRAGKSFIAKQLLHSFVKDKKNSLIVNFEEVRFDEELDKQFLVKIYDAYLSIVKPDKKPLIILDEVQEVKGWEKFVRSLNEKNEAFLVVTGSSAKLMSEELATLLTGRTLTLQIYPLTFKEFLKFKGLGIKDTFDLIKKEEKIKDLFKDYSSFGGFPEVVLEKDKALKIKILKSYYDDILTKDVIKRFKIKRIDKLERIAFYYATNFSSPITFNRIGKFLKLDEKIVEIYSKYLESSKLIFFLRRFSSSVKEQENSPRKVYLMDIGLHHLSNVLFSDRVSKIYENIVAFHLLKKEAANLFYWKDSSDKEVDFVIKKGQRIEQLIQVCYSLEKEETRRREINALLKAMEEFGLKESLVITKDHEGEETFENKKIRYLPLWKWLLAQ